jgi:hypothetical protein
MMRAYVRYYLKYTPDVLDRMTTKQLVEAFLDVSFVRKRKNPMEAEE